MADVITALIDAIAVARQDWRRQYCQGRRRTSQPEKMLVHPATYVDLLTQGRPPVFYDSTLDRFTLFGVPIGEDKTVIKGSYRFE
jgi:hypothetical protein